MIGDEAARQCHGLGSSSRISDGLKTPLSLLKDSNGQQYDPSNGTPHLPGYKSSLSTPMLLSLIERPATSGSMPLGGRLYNTTTSSQAQNDDAFFRFHRTRSPITMIGELQRTQAEYTLSFDTYVPKRCTFSGVREAQLKQAPPMGGSEFRRRNCDLVQLREHQLGPAFNNLPVMLHCDDINTTVRFGRAKTDL